MTRSQCEWRSREQSPSKAECIPALLPTRPASVIRTAFPGAASEWEGCRENVRLSLAPPENAGYPVTSHGGISSVG